MVLAQFVAVLYLFSWILGYMFAKLLPLMLVLLAVCYSTAPAWVDTGVNLNYTVGNDTITFTVASRAADALKIQVKPLSSPKTSTATENASGVSGQFWFDTGLIANAYNGKKIGDYQVTAVGKQTYAGKQWDTLTLEIDSAGAHTTKIMDVPTGLLLSQSVVVKGGPTTVITLKQFYIPAFAPPPPPPANATNPPPANNTAPAPVNASSNSTNTTASSPPQNNTQPTVVQPSQPSTPAAPTQPTGPQKEPCCLTTAFIMLILASAIFRPGT
jgi:hypothetical protein